MVRSGKVWPGCVREYQAVFAAVSANAGIDLAAIDKGGSEPWSRKPKIT